MAAVMFVAPALALYTGLGLAPLLMLVTVAILATRLAAGHGLPALPLRGTVLAGLALLWALLTIVWSVAPLGPSLDKLARLGAIILLGLALVGCIRTLAPQERTAIGRWLIVGVALALVILLVEYWGRASVLQRLISNPREWPQILDSYNRGLSFLAIVLWPAMAAAGRRHPAMAVGLVVATLTILLLYSNAAAQLAVAIGAGVGVAAFAAPRWTPRLLAIAIAATVLASPAAVRTALGVDELRQATVGLSSSFGHRLTIWQFTSDRIAERPFLGWGFYASRAIPDGDRPLGGDATVLPLHPHNAGLQWWLELGAPGVLLCGAIVVLVVWSIGNRDVGRLERATASAFAAAAVVVAELSYGIWQTWWIAALLLGVAVTENELRVREPGGNRIET